MGTQLYALYIDSAIAKRGKSSLQLMCGLHQVERLQRFPQQKNCCHMGFTEAVNDSIYASLACLIIGLGYTPLCITRCCTAICIPPLHSCFVSKYTNKFVIVECLTFFFSPSHS